MNPISKAAWKFWANARKKPAELFRSQFVIGPDTRILDLGSETGDNIHNVLNGTAALPSNVYIADIAKDAVTEGNRRYGFNPVLINEGGAGV